MADNVTITAGSGTTVAADDIAGVFYQRVKLAHGADGTATDVSTTAPLPVTQQASTPTVVAVPGSATAVTLLAANTARRGACIFNDSTAALYVKWGAGATTALYTARVAPGQLYELPLPVYTGILTGIWSAAAGNAMITEVA